MFVMFYFMRVPDMGVRKYIFKPINFVFNVIKTEKTIVMYLLYRFY